MKGFFGIFNNTIFQLTESADIYDYHITANDIESSTYIHDDPRDHHVNLDITISDISGNMLSNKEQIENIVLKIQNEKIKSIKKLGTL